MTRWSSLLVLHALLHLHFQYSFSFQINPSSARRHAGTSAKMTNLFSSNSDEAIRKRIEAMDLVYKGEKIIEGMKPSQVWDFVADTDALNHNMGHSAKVAYEPVSNGVSRRQIEWKLHDITLEYQEEPFQWDSTNFWWHVLRTPHEGPIESVRFFVHIHPDGDSNSKIEMISAVKSRDGDVEAADAMMKELDLFFHTRADESLDMLNNRQQWKLASSKVANAHQLEVLTRSLYDLGEDRDVVDQLIHHLVHTQDSNLIDMQPLGLASKWKVDDEATISCFLRAARIGLLEPRWSLMCPGCRGSKASRVKAFDIPEDAHCPDCNISIRSNPRTSMQMVFGTSVRGDIGNALPGCVGSPTRTPHILSQSVVDSGQTQSIMNTSKFRDANSKLVLKCPDLQVEKTLDGGKLSGTWKVDQNGFFETSSEGNHPDTLVICNQSPNPIRVFVEDLNPSKYTRPLSAEAVMKNPGFKTLFGAEEWDFLNAMTGKFSMEFGQEQSLPSETEDGWGDLDIAVIGSGPAGESLALASARLGKRVALIEQAKCFGGPTGLGSKAFREAALKVLAWSKLNDGRPTASMMQKTFNSRFAIFRDYAVTLVSHELMSRLGTAGVSLIRGHGEIEGDGVKVTRSDGHVMKVQSSYIGVAVGSRPARPPGIPFDAKKVLDAEEISKISKLPESIVIVGGGIIAIEYASIFGALGVQAHVVNAHPTFLPMLERTLCDSLLEVIESTGVMFHRQVKIDEWHVADNGPVTLKLSNGDELVVETALYAQGREGSTDNLVKDDDMELTWSKRGFLQVGDDFGAGHKGVYAIGDVVGGGVASTAMDHGRRLAESLFVEDSSNTSSSCVHESSPLVLWTIPEVASVGMKEQASLEANVPTVSVRAEFRELPRGLLTGDLEGYLDLLVDARSGTILGVHLMGTGASELVHYGARLVKEQVTVEDLSRRVFAAVTLHDLFHVAADRARLKLCEQENLEKFEDGEMEDFHDHKTPTTVPQNHETRGLEHSSASNSLTP